MGTHAPAQLINLTFTNSVNSEFFVNLVSSRLITVSSPWKETLLMQMKSANAVHFKSVLYLKSLSASARGVGPSRPKPRPNARTTRAAAANEGDQTQAPPISNQLSVPSYEDVLRALERPSDTESAIQTKYELLIAYFELAALGRLPDDIAWKSCLKDGTLQRIVEKIFEVDSIRHTVLQMKMGDAN